MRGRGTHLWRRRRRQRGPRSAPGLSAVLTMLLLLLAACGGGSEGETDGPVELRFSWWGADERAEMTNAAIAAFEEAHPDISVEGEYVEWSAYWDRLATGVAANDAPDILMQEERFLREYATRGALLDLSEHEDTIDLSQMDPLVLDSGRVDDGLYGLASGVNVYSVLADPQAFADAGVEMPDDTTWTWDDYARISAEISKASGGKVFGTTDYGGNEAGFKIWARQRGEGLYNQEGELGFTPATMAEWWQLSLELRDSGATPTASRSIEVQDAGGPEQTLIGTNQGAMMFNWSNQLGAHAEAAGRELVLLRSPGESELEQPGMYLKPAMAYAISSQTEHPEEAAMFVDFMLNSDEAIDAIGTDRGLPANLEQRERITPTLEGVQATEAEFIADIADELESVPPAPPTGAGETVDIIKRLNTEVLFDRMTPQEAAEGFISETEAAIGQ